MARSYQPMSSRFFALEMLLFTTALFAGVIILWSLFTAKAVWIPGVAGVFFTASVVVLLRLILDPDNVRARQTDSMLRLAGQTLACVQDGLNEKSAQKVCRLLLPSSSAAAVAITDKERILGYIGIDSDVNPIGGLVQTQATHDTIKDGGMRILYSFDEIGFPVEKGNIGAAIIVPLAFGGHVEGTLKFYYRRPQQISETQKSIAEGFGKLLSTQIAASALEQQTKLATSMELKMLQSQINPHFLFNTINTIASLVRTDPTKARVLLREFAVFYRRTLEGSADLITLNRELEQTSRYFTFEMARFGEDRLLLKTDIAFDVGEVLIPSFLIQPLVENSVRHALPSTGRLEIVVTGERQGDDVLICVKDNGVGMSEEDRLKILKPASSKGGMGIAVKNIHDRMRGYFGTDSQMKVESEVGKGTTISLLLKDGALNNDALGENALKNESLLFDDDLKKLNKN